MTVDQGIIELARERLYAVVMPNALDSLAYRHQVMAPRIRLFDESLVLVAHSLNATPFICRKTTSRAIASS